MGPLDGIRVLEAGLLVQGPQASLTMLEWGADVIKVELPGFGDQSRWLPVSREDRRSAFFAAYNRGKRSVTIDLRVPRGREVFLRMVETADVVITNFKPGTMDEWGVGFADAAARNERIIYAMGSSFGTEGSRCGAGRRRPRCAGGGWVDQHDRWERQRPERHRGDRGRPHLGAEPPGRRSGGAARQRADRAGAAGGDLPPRRADLGPGRRVHQVLPDRAALRAERPQSPHDPRHLRGFPDVGRLDRHRRGRRCSS